MVPLEVNLNDECDILAKRHVSMASVEECTKPTAVMAPSDRAALFLEGAMITNKYKERICHSAMAPHLVTHLCRWNRWHRATFDLIDWEIHGVMCDRLARSSPHRFARIVKFVYGIQNTGRQKRLFSQQLKNAPVASDLCPCCSLYEETTMHLHQCLAPAIVGIRTKMMGEFEDKLRLRRMPSAMWTAMRQGIASFVGKAPPRRVAAEGLTKEAYDEQSEIGWDNFLKGRILKK